jgi:hypothetical protein
MKNSEDLKTLMNLTLFLIHSGLFKMGLDMLRKMCGLPDTEKIARYWQLVYIGIAIICNCLTPSHRNSKGRPEWYDVLVSYSGPGMRPMLSIQWDCCQGLWNHLQASGIFMGMGNRVCYAHFMRESVRKRLGVPLAGWVA